MKNLAELKRALKVGTKFEILDHRCPEKIGIIREMTKVQTNGFYAKRVAGPEETCRSRLGFWLEFGKAGIWGFDGDTITHFWGPDKTDIVIKFRILEA